MKTTLCLFCVAVLCFVLSGCATPEATTATIAAAGASAVALIDALAPLLPPEDLARLQATAGNIDGTVQATASALRTVCDAISSMKSTAGTQIADVARNVQALSVALAQAPTQEQVMLQSGGAAALATGASRALSAAKHGYVGKCKTDRAA